MAKGQFSLHIADYAVASVTTLIALGIGIYHAFAKGGQTTTAKYLVGNRNMGIFPVSISLVVTYMSSIFLLGNPAEAYVYGSPAILGFAFVILFSNAIACVIIVPLMYPLNITSSYEYLLLRFNSRLTQKLGSFLGMLKNTVYMGIVLYGPAIALEAVAGFPDWASILLVALSSVIYTSIGGFKAVIWTDVFQMGIMIFGLLAIIIKCLVDIESVRDFWQYNVEGKRIRMFQFDPDPTIRTGFWSLFFGGTSLWFATTFNQQAVQRIISMPSKRAAYKVMMMAVPGFIVLAILAALQGWAAYAYYTNKRCDPFEEGVISKSNEILPYFVMELFNDYPGFPGIFLAALFSASLSTLSSGLNSLSAITLNDYVKPIWPKIKDTQATMVAKFLVLVFGILSVGFSFIIMQIGGPITQVTSSLLGSLSGPNCGMFVLGAFFPWANGKGVITGAFTGLGITLWITMGASTYVKVPWLPPAPSDMCNMTSDILNMTSHTFSNISQSQDFIIWSDTPYNATGLVKFYSMSYSLYTLVGLFTTIIVGLFVSLVTGPNKPSDVDPKYISHLVRRLFYGANVKVTYDSDQEMEVQVSEKPQPVNDFTEKYTLKEGTFNHGFSSDTYMDKKPSKDNGQF